MPLLFNKLGKVIGTFDFISKKLLKKFNIKEKVFKEDVFILKIGNDAFEYYYLDKETAEKYNVSNRMILTDEDYLLNDTFENFLEDIDIILSEKINKIYE